MAMPVTVTGLLANAASMETTCGPFVTAAGNVYVFGRGTTGNLLRAFKNTNPTTNSFTNVGTDVTTTSTEDILGCVGVQQGNLIYVIVSDGNAVTTVSIRLNIFDTSSDTWTTTNEAVTTGFTVLALSTPNAMGVAIRSTGDLIVIYNGPVKNISAANRETVYYGRRVAGVWTKDIDIGNGGANNWYAGGVVLGSSDRMHFFFNNDTAADDFQRCLTSANVLETFPAAFDATVGTNQAGIKLIGCSYLSAGATKVRYPYLDNANLTLGSVKFDSADTPSITLDADITGATDVVGGANRSCFQADGTTLYHLFIDSLTDVKYQTNADDAGWSAITNLITGTASGVRGAMYSRAGRVVLAYIYNNSTTPVYNELDIRADAFIGTRNVTLAAATQAGTGLVAVAGAKNANLAAATLVSTGKVALAGAKNATLAAATLSASGKVFLSGTRSATLAAATLAGTGTVAGPFTFGTFVNTLEAATLAAAGTVRVTGSKVATLAAATMAGDADTIITGSFNNTLAAATLVATGVVTNLPVIVGTRNITLAAATLSAAGTVGNTPPVPAPILPSDSSGGSGNRSGDKKRRIFLVPEDDVEPRTLEKMLGIREEEPEPEELPPVPVVELTLAEAVAASPSALQDPSTLPLSSPVAVEIEEYSDEDLIQLLLLVI